MADFYPFAGPGKIDRMFADNITGPDGLDTYFLISTLADNPVPFKNTNLGQIPSQGPGCHLAQLESGSGGGIFLHPVMGFNDLYIIGIAQDCRSLFHQLKQHIDAHSHVRGLHTGKIAVSRLF